jgi:hypothetical protein
VLLYIRLLLRERPIKLRPYLWLYIYNLFHMEV